MVETIQIERSPTVLTFFDLSRDQPPFDFLFQIKANEDFDNKLISVKNFIQNTTVKQLVINALFTDIPNMLEVFTMLMKTDRYNIFFSFDNKKFKIFDIDEVQKAIIQNEEIKFDKDFSIKSYLLIDLINLQRKGLERGKFAVIVFSLFGKTFFKEKPNGGFFPYINTIPYDLTTLGIYNTKTLNVEACIITALKTYGVCMSSLYNIENMLNSHFIKLIDMKEVSDIIGLCIKVTRLYDTKNIYIYGKSNICNGVIKLILFKGHLFLDYKMPGCIYAFKNYPNTYSLYDEWYYYNQIINGRYYKKKCGLVSSRSIVKILYEKGLFKKIAMNDKFMYHSF